jgi:hypothetical protein
MPEQIPHGRGVRQRYREEKALVSVLDHCDGGRTDPEPIQKPPHAVKFEVEYEDGVWPQRLDLVDYHGREDARVGPWAFLS